jgi:type II secretory pathway component PulJ
MVVTALLITLIGSFMVQNLQQSSSTTTQASLLNQSQTALNVMGADVRSSSFVELHNSVTDPSDPAPGYWA